MKTPPPSGGARPKKSPARPTRNPEKSAGRILEAALHEFAEKGFAGARVDGIARRAGINKRMLYHYFGDKEALFRAVLTKKIDERQALDQALVGNPEDNVPFWFASACKDPDWVRMLQWEALQYPQRKLIGMAKRQDAAAYALERIRQGQKCGKLSKEFNPAQMLLTFRSLTFFPIAFPQLTRMITGREVTDPQFQRDRVEFLKKFARAFRPWEAARVNGQGTPRPRRAAVGAGNGTANPKSRKRREQILTGAR